MSDQLTPDQIEQLGRMLLPIFQQAIRIEFHSLRNDFNASLIAQNKVFDEKLTAQTTELEEAIDELRKDMRQLGHRVTALEKVKGKVMLAYGVVIGAATIVFDVAKEKLFGKK